MSLRMKQHYIEVCTEQNQPVNPFIAEMLTQTEEQGSSASTLKLCGNNRLVKVQRVIDEDFLSLSQVLKKHIFITNLDLRYNNLSDNGAIYIADFLQNNSSLFYLNLMGNDIGTNGSEHIAEALKSNESILSLRMTGNKIGNKGGMVFASMLQINSTLEELDLGDCDLLQKKCIFTFKEYTTIHLAEMLKLNKTLTELHLCKHEMTDFGVQRLCDALLENSHLKYLDLGCNKITRDGVKCLADVLKSNKTLEILDLSSNRMEDEGVIYIAEAIHLYNNSLKALSVVSNNITGKGLQALTAAIKANDCLLYVYIWGNILDKDASEAFSHLLESGRLSLLSTDVRPYTVDGRVYLAELFHGLKKNYYWTPSYGMADDSVCNSVFAVIND
ncbi:hypothetical protein GDO86_010107 [Hymenochirus boettgeri]|uniref:Leucine rich repeat containing 34 n=1 Tax=Hymenochirus boettgeri TaxID=247094 RepID=A0A8T2JRL2_9PIPI|nr:hypothetical protein GDO86_010107 [Hymenochirus boettgeri]